MSRRRKSKAKAKKLLPEPGDVLKGRVEARVEDLFDLIHQVNPTLKGLARKEETRRYALKNRLQSLLIRLFGDEHLKVETTVHRGVVSLEHISGVRDACHAVIAELEPDARSWVRRQLDLAASGVGEEVLELPDVTGGEEDEGVDALLQRSRRALEEYDYERGEELLRQAFAESRSGPEGETLRLAAAQALLELQVDLLGMDTAALELESRLSAAAKEQPAVRTLLALAAARLGDAERALRLVKGLTPAMAGVSLPRAAAVYAALASRALESRDRRAARSHLERIAEFDPGHPEILRLEAEIARLRGVDLHAVEAELERRFRELGAAAVEEEARALADRWSEGEVARRILRQAAGERREAEVAEHLELAGRAQAEERLDDGARHFQAAIDAGCERPDLPALVAELSDRDRRRRERREVEGVVTLLEAAAGQEKRRGAAQRDALLAYLSLAEELRTRVRAATAQPALEWLDEFDAPHKGARAQAAVAAVVALERASAAFERGEAQTVVDGLEAHRTTLRLVAAARDLWDEAHRRLGRETLAAAQTAFDRGHLADAGKLLDAVPRGDLDAEDLARAEDLTARIADAERGDRLEREHDEHLAAGDLTAALRRARALARRTRERPEHRRWAESCAELEGRIRSDWRFEVVTGGAPLSEMLRPSHWREHSVVWLDDEGRELVLANTWDRWLFIDAIDLERRRITDRVSLRTPRPLAQPLITRRHGDRLWISGRDGDVLEIARDGWKLHGFYPLNELLAGERGVDGAMPLPGGRWMWIDVSGPHGGGQIGVIDLEEWFLVKRLPAGLIHFFPILGAGEPRMLVSGRRLSGGLYTADGERQPGERLARGIVLDGDVGPDGQGFLLLVDEADPASRDRDLVLVRLTPRRGANGTSSPRRGANGILTSTPSGGWRQLARLELPDAHPLGSHTVVTADAGLSYVLVQNRGGGDELRVYSPREVSASGRLEPLHLSVWPGGTTLAHDWRARHVVALGFADGLEVQHLDAAPEPPDDGARRTQGRGFPRYQVYAKGCGQPTGAFGDQVLELAGELGEHEHEVLRVRLAKLGAGKKETDADERVRFVLALQEIDHYSHKKAIEEFARILARKHPRHAGAALLQADLEAKAENWDEVQRLLRRPSPADLDASRARHFHHLVGLAHLHGGRLDDAFEAFRRGSVHEGRCDLELLMHLTQPMTDPPAEDEWSADQPTIRRLVGAIRTADQAHAKGDTAAARAALERDDVRWHAEVQIAARRAHVWLEPAPVTANERFRQRAALSFYAHVRQLENWVRHDLFLPGVHWEEERLEELEVRVRARLTEL